MDGGGKSIFFKFTFCDSNETFIFMFKFSIESCPQMQYELVVPKKQKFKRKWTFDILKFKFLNGLKLEISIFWSFLRQTCP